MNNQKTAVDIYLTEDILEEHLEMVELDEVLPPRRLSLLVQGELSWREDAENCFIGDYIEEDPRHVSPSREAIKIDYSEMDENIKELAQKYIHDLYSESSDPEFTEKYEAHAEGMKLSLNSVAAIRNKRNSTSSSVTFPSVVVDFPIDYNPDQHINQALGPTEIENVVSRPDQLVMDDQFATNKTSDKERVSTLTDDLTVYAMQIRDNLRSVDEDDILPSEFYDGMNESIEELRDFVSTNYHSI